MGKIAQPYSPRQRVYLSIRACRKMFAFCLGAAALSMGCAGKPAAPFDAPKTSNLTAFRLGEAERFPSHFRIPIERSGNQQRLEALRDAVTPFMLRRMKESGVDPGDSTLAR